MKHGDFCTWGIQLDHLQPVVARSSVNICFVLTTWINGMIWSNRPMGASHLVKTKRTMTDERAIELILYLIFFNFLPFILRSPIIYYPRERKLRKRDSPKCEDLILYLRWISPNSCTLIRRSCSPRISIHLFLKFHLQTQTLKVSIYVVSLGLHLLSQTRWHLKVPLFLFQKSYHGPKCCTNWLVHQT